MVQGNRKFKEIVPDLVIMDITMPELDEFVKEIRKVTMKQNNYVFGNGTGYGY